MNLHHIHAIVWKQWKDTLRNKPILIQFIMFPALAAILTSSTANIAMPPRFFVSLFSSMYAAMAPILILSAIISEEKEKGSLRFLMLSSVKPLEYIIGIGSYVFILCMIGLACMGWLGEYSGKQLFIFLLLHACSVLLSTLLGAAIGVISENQTAASGLSVPMMLITSFIPMLSMFNSTIRNFGQYLYTQQIHELAFALPNATFTGKSCFILAMNFIVLVGFYIYCYRKRNLLV